MIPTATNAHLLINLLYSLVMKISIVIPCYNEFNTIREIVKRVYEAPVSGGKEIIVIDDASTDGTRQLLEKELKNYITHLICQPTNQGKGSALQKGITVATGDIIILQDADLEYDPKEYPKLIRPILEYGADVVFGSRFLGGDCQRVLYFWHRIANWCLTTLSNMFTNLNLTDMETCYKVFKRSALEGVVIQEKRFGIEPEITAKIAKKKCVVYEVGISYHGRTYAEGKKIRWWDGFRALYCIVRYNI
jgi:glycosyltransferase involved in cell wall biosynthesis